MFIAHLPAGYIASHMLRDRLRVTPKDYSAYVWAALLGSVAPDFDLFYFYLFDHRWHNHHTYFTHFPVVWLSLLLGAGFALWYAKRKFTPLLAFMFSLNGLIHMVLDSVFGHIWWLAPWSDYSFNMFSVRKFYDHWWLNYLFHWGLAVELLIVLWAFHLWRKSVSRQNCFASVTTP
ncbi:metal-dependent hydrolase [Uliginosibacterium gangwonense]|uniref:metal-dependent hydrolase n=1 Tax=Uliginosibacterium gangwonense TaxID=392736 RepID=UPI00036ED080|nr:metal-dependent hydrolase [Uliginosibacterium gangwonense]